MIKQLLLLILISSSFSCLAQTRLSTKDSIQLSNQKTEMESLRKNVDLTNTLVSTGNSMIANRLAATSDSINAFGVMVTIALVVVGIYFNRVDNRVRKIDRDISKRLIEIEEIERRVQQMQDDINNNIQKIFNDLQTQELNYLLPVIEETPILFSALESKLIGLNITDDYFNRFYALKSSINKIFSGTGINSIQYAFQAVMFYHFPTKMLLTAECNHINKRYLSQEKRVEIIRFILKYSKQIPHRFEHVRSLIISMDPEDQYFKDLASLLKPDEIERMIIKESPTKPVHEHHIARNKYFSELLESKLN